MRPEHVEVHRVLLLRWWHIPPILDVIECPAAAQKIVRDVQQMIRLEIRQLQQQNRHLIDLVKQLALHGDLMNHRHPAVRYCTCLLQSHKPPAMPTTAAHQTPPASDPSDTQPWPCVRPVNRLYFSSPEIPPSLKNNQTSFSAIGAEIQGEFQGFFIHALSAFAGLRTRYPTSRKYQVFQIFG